MSVCFWDYATCLYLRVRTRSNHTQNHDCGVQVIFICAPMVVWVLCWACVYVIFCAPSSCLFDLIFETHLGTKRATHCVRSVQRFFAKCSLVCPIVRIRPGACSTRSHLCLCVWLERVLSELSFHFPLCRRNTITLTICYFGWSVTTPSSRISHGFSVCSGKFVCWKCMYMKTQSSDRHNDGFIL